MPLTVIFITIIVTTATPMGYTAVTDPCVCLPQGRPGFHSSLCPKASIESVAYGAQTVSYPIPEFSIGAPSRYLCCWWTGRLVSPDLRAQLVLCNQQCGSRGYRDRFLSEVPWLMLRLKSDGMYRNPSTAAF